MVHVAAAKWSQPTIAATMHVQQSRFLAVAAVVSAAAVSRTISVPNLLMKSRGLQRTQRSGQCQIFPVQAFQRAGPERKRAVQAGGEL